MSNSTFARKLPNSVFFCASLFAAYKCSRPMKLMEFFTQHSMMFLSILFSLSPLNGVSQRAKSLVMSTLADELKSPSSFSVRFSSHRARSSNTTQVTATGERFVHDDVKWEVGNHTQSIAMTWHEWESSGLGLIIVIIRVHIFHSVWKNVSTTVRGRLSSVA